MRLQALLVLLPALLLSNVSLAQDTDDEPKTPRRPAPKREKKLPVSQATVEDLPAGPGDQLSVTVAGEPDITRIYTVDEEGNISIPMIGKVAVKGMFTPQVREELGKRLARIIREPQVTVDYFDRPLMTIGFTGMVVQPGTVQLRRGSRLLDGLAQAEGLTPEADSQNVRLQRRGETQARIVDLTRLLLKGEGALNLELKEGDAVFVPRLPVHVIRVLGAVNKPGEFQRKEPITLLDALLTAGGLHLDADRRKVQLLRKGASEPELVNLDEVLSGSLVNRTLQDGDALTIPAVAKIGVKVFGSVAKPGESQMKIGATLLEAVTQAGGFGMDADRTAVFVTAPSGDVRRANLEKLESPDGAMPLTDGARVFVPQMALLYYAVAGGVTQPGRYPMPQEGKGKIYLTDALAQAGGLVQAAKKKNLVLVRKNPSGGQPQLHPIDFEAITRKKDPAANLEILAGDVVIVDMEPDRERKPSTIERILGIAGAFVGF